MFLFIFHLGIDAAVALDFHHKREAHPEKFKSRFGNKVRYYFLFVFFNKINNNLLFFSYTVIGSTKLFYDSDLYKNVELTVDGKSIPIPSQSEGFVFLFFLKFDDVIRINYIEFK